MGIIMKNNDQSKRPGSDGSKKHCKICLHETHPIRKCTCIALGSGSGSDEIATLKSSNNDQVTPIASSAHIQKNDQAVPPANQSANQLTLSNPNFNKLNIIQALINNKILSFNCDAEIGMITLVCKNPNLLSEEQKIALKEFVAALIKEFEQLLTERKITDKQYTPKIKKDHNGNILSLTLTAPTHGFYDSFIQQLTNKNLLPQPTPKPNLIKEEQQESKRLKRPWPPTPFPTRLIPPGE